MLPADERDVPGDERMGVDGRVRLALVFIVREVVQPVLYERAAERAGHLLILIRDDAILHFSPSR